MNATTTNAKISARILYHIANGLTVAAAIDAVLGAGQYEAIVSDLYDALRAKAAAQAAA
jgi:hypothetical protein